jgi:1,4-dihydroxy-2-naphthoate octaprenyltransferase
VSRRIVAFVKLGRPQFLAGGFLQFGLGAAIAAAAGHAIDARRYALGQLAVTALQWMTHYSNDYFDYEADRANATPTRWSGGSRVLVSGGLPRPVALIAALVLGSLGIAAAAGVAHAGAGALALPSFAVVAVLAWSYSAPPLRLCGRGLGELTTAAVVTALVPWLGFYLQAPDLRGAGWLAASIVPPALLQLAMLLAIEFPDAAGDAATGKRTLVVRLGAARGARLYAAITAAAFLWLPVAYALGLPGRLALAAGALAPFGAWRVARITEHRDPAAHERIALYAVALLVAVSGAELAAWL